MRKNFSKGTMPARNKKNFRPTKSGAGMTQAGVKAYRRLNPGSKLKTAVTGKEMEMLTKRQKTTLKKHSKHHSSKHMTSMKKDMKKGMSFSKSHKKAMKKVGA